MTFQKSRRGVLLGALCMGVVASLPATAQGWKPEKTIEIIVPTGAGGTNDQLARLIQKSLQDHKLSATPALVLNKPGGNQSIAVLYVDQHAGDPHHLLYGTATVFTNQIAGLTKVGYKELTPLALLLVDYTVISVKADSPMKGMRDLVGRLKANPESVSFGLVSRGGPNHLAAAQAMRSAGIDPKRLKLVVFKTNAESITAVMGGHIDAMVSSVSAAMPQTQAGNARMLAVAAPQRLGGSLAKLPTMREQGIEATGISNWRTIFGAKGLTAAHSTFWQDALEKTVSTPEWKQQLDSNNVEPEFRRGTELVKWLDGEYAATRAVMADLGLVK
ncbi:MAG TPA: tripartite tricarboxylate transporter substrate binding protein [Burkholderiales bacterium]|nr:tripartite tricarboxylate transporter substrate binding protein [Burkholderiales bacterium]